MEYNYSSTNFMSAYGKTLGEVEEKTERSRASIDSLIKLNVTWTE